MTETTTTYLWYAAPYIFVAGAAVFGLALAALVEAVKKRKSS